MSKQLYKIHKNYTITQFGSLASLASRCCLYICLFGLMIKQSVAAVSSSSSSSHFRITCDASNVQNFEGNRAEEDRHEAHSCVG